MANLARFLIGVCQLLEDAVPGSGLCLGFSNVVFVVNLLVKTAQNTSNDCLQKNNTS